MHNTWDRRITVETPVTSQALLLARAALRTLCVDLVADPLSAVQLLRVSGCAGILPALEPLQPDGQLDRAAALWAAGGSAANAVAQSGYSAQVAVGLRLRGTNDSILQALRRTRCRPVVDQSLRNIGVYRSSEETWLVIASQALMPEAEQTSVRAFAYAKAPAVAAPEVAAPDVQRASLSATRVLQLVNEVRASGTRCGDKSFGSAPPLQLSATLEGVASEHAMDMAQQDYFEHVDLQGHTPRTAFAPRAIGRGWSARTSPMDRLQPMKSCRGGLAVPGTVRTSWTQICGNGSG